MPREELSVLAAFAVVADERSGRKKRRARKWPSLKDSLAGWTGLEPATSDVTGTKDSSAAEGVTKTGQRVTTTGSDKERHE